MSNPFKDFEEKETKSCRIEEKIGEGAFGTVYRAFHEPTKKIVAVKDLFISSKSKAVIERELAILTKIPPHPNIISLVAAETSQSKCRLIMEFADYDLKRYIESALYPLSSNKVRRIAYSILQGLKHLHDLGIIHRDLKPSNILVSKNFCIKLGDFGSAIFEKAKEKSIEGCFSIEGFTRWYMSPEQLFGSRTYTSSIDIWSFACIYFEILAGYPLFPGNTEIEQIARIADILGDPSEPNWPSIVNMPDYGKIIFKEKPKKNIASLLPHASQIEIAFLQKILTYDQRPTVEEILNDEYFNGFLLKDKSDDYLNLPPRREESQHFNYCSLLDKK